MPVAALAAPRACLASTATSADVPNKTSLTRSWAGAVCLALPASAGEAESAAEALLEAEDASAASPLPTLLVPALLAAAGFDRRELFWRPLLNRRFSEALTSTPMCSKSTTISNFIACSKKSARNGTSHYYKQTNDSWHKTRDDAHSITHAAHFFLVPASPWEGLRCKSVTADRPAP